MSSRVAAALLALLAAPVGAAQTAFDEGRAAFDDNRLGEAVPLFRSALADGSPDAALWLADALRRTGQLDGDTARVAQAAALARAETRRQPCNAHAHHVLAETLNPQYLGWPGASADSAWHHLGRAVACDPDDGNAWVALWVEAERRGDAGRATDALRALDRIEFWAPPVVAFARWTLASAPPDAVLLTNGDADTIPLAMAQALGGLRPDVAVVNVPLLDLPDLAERQVERHGLPRPDSLGTFEPRIDQRGSWGTPDGWVFSLRDHVVHHWIEEDRAGRLGRPLVAALTLDPGILGSKTYLTDRGAFLDPEPEQAFDAETARAAFAGLDGADFRGPLVSDGDRSPVRRAFPFDPGALVLFQWLQTAVTFAQDGDRAAAEATYADAVAFAQAFGTPNDLLVETARQWIDDALGGR